ncbi:DUF6710 family protein [Cytobacillus firmus]|uniref:DUF6710 family protein n=1 Tax=Cytobacillus firmus TaxID=1399 RepID=UPI003001C3B5
MLNFLTKKKRNINEDSLKYFKSIMAVAISLLKNDSPIRLYDLIYALGKPYQFEVINQCIKDKPLSKDKAFAFEHLFLKNANEKYLFTKLDESGMFINYTNSRTMTTIHPSSSLIFSFPWNLNRLCDAFKDVGEKVGNKWEHDPLNHRVVHFYPLNIGYVTNGNHSTVMNIINNEAPMNITEELDLAPVYDEIYTDGQYFRRIHDDIIVDEVTSVEFAAIFEIGRLILNNSLQIAAIENKSKETF